MDMNAFMTFMANAKKPAIPTATDAGKEKEGVEKDLEKMVSCT